MHNCLQINAQGDAGEAGTHTEPLFVPSPPRDSCPWLNGHGWGEFPPAQISVQNWELHLLWIMAPTHTWFPLTQSKATLLSHQHCGAAQPWLAHGCGWNLSHVPVTLGMSGSSYTPNKSSLGAAGIHPANKPQPAPKHRASGLHTCAATKLIHNFCQQVLLPSSTLWQALKNQA